MGRAPRAVQPMALSRTRQRMAPGGRMWGESPIRELQNDRLLLRGAGLPITPVNLSAVYYSGRHFEEDYGNGQVYPLPPASTTVNLPTDELTSKNITGRPMVAVVGTTEWVDATPPAGWSRPIRQIRSASAPLREVSVWMLDAWDGHGFTGTIRPGRTPGLSGAKFMCGAMLFVGDVPGRWDVTVGALGTGTSWVLTDPGGTQRVQILDTDTRWDRFPAGMGGSRIGTVNHSVWKNPANGGDPQWYTPGEILEQPVKVGTFTAADGQYHTNVNIRWAG